MNILTSFNYLSILDILGTIIAIIGTYYATKARLAMWGYYFIATIINIIIYYHSKLYITMLLEFAYSVLSIVGYINWYYTTNNHINNITIRDIIYYEIIYYGIILVTLIPSIGYLNYTYNNHQLIILETIAVTISIIAYLLSINKIIQNWLLYLIADLIFIIIMLYAGYIFHAMLFTIYTMMALQGWKNWHNIKKKQGLILCNS